MATVRHPQLGDRVTFSHHWDRPTRDEIEAVYEDSSTITLMRRGNPTPELPAVVVGVGRFAFEALVDENDNGRVFAVWSGPLTKTAYFYVVKQTLRGRRFLVKPEDMASLEQNNKAPTEAIERGE